MCVRKGIVEAQVFVQESLANSICMVLDGAKLAMGCWGQWPFINPPDSPLHLSTRGSMCEASGLLHSACLS